MPILICFVQPRPTADEQVGRYCRTSCNIDHPLPLRTRILDLLVPLWVVAEDMQYLHMQVLSARFPTIALVPLLHGSANTPPLPVSQRDGRARENQVATKRSRSDDAGSKIGPASKFSETVALNLQSVTAGRTSVCFRRAVHKGQMNSKSARTAQKRRSAGRGIASAPAYLQQEIAN